MPPKKPVARKPLKVTKIKEIPCTLESTRPLERMDVVCIAMLLGMVFFCASVTAAYLLNMYVFKVCA